MTWRGKLSSNGASDHLNTHLFHKRKELFSGKKPLRCYLKSNTIFLVTLSKHAFHSELLSRLLCQGCTCSPSESHLCSWGSLCSQKTKKNSFQGSLEMIMFRKKKTCLCVEKQEGLKTTRCLEGFPCLLGSFHYVNFRECTVGRTHADFTRKASPSFESFSVLLQQTRL